MGWLTMGRGRRAVAAGTVALLLGIGATGIGGASAHATAQAQASWPTEVACTACHGAQDPAQMADDVHGLMETPTHAALACDACHADAAVLGPLHEGVSADAKMPKALKKSTVERETCLVCHAGVDGSQAKADAAEGAADGEGFLAATEERDAKAPADGADAATPQAPQVPEGVMIEDANGLAVDVHQIPDVEEHAKVTCASCHSAHGNKKTTEQLAKKACTTCHHEDVFACGTCH